MYICNMNTDFKYRFCSSYYRDAAVRLVIKDKRMFFLRKSKPLRGRNLVGASSEGRGKRMVLKPDADGGYDLSSHRRAARRVSDIGNRRSDAAHFALQLD